MSPRIKTAGGMVVLSTLIAAILLAGGPGGGGGDPTPTPTPTPTSTPTPTPTATPEPGFAHLFVAPSSCDTTPTRQSSPTTFAEADASAIACSFDQAYDAANVSSAATDVIVKEGTYGDQTVTGNRTSSNMISFTEAEGETVTLSGLSAGNGTTAQGPDYVSFEGFATTYWGQQPAPQNQGGIDAQMGATHVDFIDIDAGSLYANGAQDIRFLGGDYGPCDAAHNGSNYDSGPCGNSKIEQTDYVSGDPKTKNITIDGALFHDYRFDDSCYPSADCHWECLFITGGAEGLTITNSTFRRCAIMDLFLTWSACGDQACANARSDGYDDIVITNNWFERPMTEGTYGSTSRRPTPLNFGHCGTFPASNQYDGLIVAFNTFDRGAITNDSTCTTASGGAPEAFVGNIQYNGSCLSWLDYEYNWFTDGDHSGGCDSTDVDASAGGSTGPFVDTDESGDMDYHLTGTLGTLGPENLVPTTVSGGCPATDIDGDSRPQDTNCDAGSDER